MAAAHLLIRKHYDCFNQRRFADGADLFSEDCVLEHPPFGQTRHGRQGYLDLVNEWVQAFPDGHMHIDHVEQRGDTICEVDLVGTGTHLGDFNMGGYGIFKASGAKTTLRFRELIEIRGGKITFSSITFDPHDLIRQLGSKPLMEDVPTILWTLHREGREAACRARLAPYGIEIDLTSDGDLVVTRVFETGEEALAWADKKRADRETQGWRPAGAQ